MVNALPQNKTNNKLYHYALYALLSLMILFLCHNHFKNHTIAYVTNTSPNFVPPIKTIALITTQTVFDNHNLLELCQTNADKQYLLKKGQLKVIVERANNHEPLQVSTQKTAYNPMVQNAKIYSPYLLQTNTNNLNVLYFMAK